MNQTKTDKTQTILSNAENPATQNAGQIPPSEQKSLWRRCLDWCKELDASDRSSILFSLFMDPVFVIFLIYGLTGYEVWIPLVYIIMDPLLLWGWVHSENKRRARIAAIPENYKEYMLRKLDEIFGPDDDEAEANEKTDMADEEQYRAKN